MRKFLLYCFTDGDSTVMTRGVTEEQALSYVVHSRHFKRGVSITPVHILPINGFTLYSTNHYPGWLYRPPRWLKKLEDEYAIKIGYKKVLDMIVSNIDFPIMLFNK